MRSTASEFENPKRPLKLTVITWNMGQAPPKEEEVEHIVPSKGDGLDIVAVGLQESNYKVEKAERSTSHFRSFRNTLKVTPIHEEDRPFPQSLKSFGLQECRALPLVNLLSEPARYKMPEEGLVAVLADADIACDGLLSPASPCPPSMGGVGQLPASQLLVRFAYPTDASTEWLRGLRQDVRYRILEVAACKLLLFGGFLVFDANSEGPEGPACVAAFALCPGDELRFQGPCKMGSTDLLERLAAEDRFFPPSITDFVAAGVEHMCWIAPGEDLGSGIAPLPQGGFLFVFSKESGREPIYYQVSSDSRWCDSAVKQIPSFLGLHAFTEHSEVEEKEDEEDIFHFFQLVKTHLGDEWKIVEHIETSTTHGMGIRLAIFARNELVIIDKKTTWCNTGIGFLNVRAANKGGVVICFDVRGTSLCFINSHLSANLKGIARRRQDCEMILSSKGARLRNTSLDLTMQFDHCFWFGDLNYRVDPADSNDSESTEKAPAVVTKVMSFVGSPDEMMSHDQLCRIRKDKTDFTGFEEGVITHAPSYKVKRDVGIKYDAGRAPAYTDRVIWKSLPHCRQNLTQTRLDMVAQLTSSDHKPVVACFQVMPSEKCIFDTENPNEALAIWVQRLQISGLPSGDQAELDLTRDITVEVHGLPQPLLDKTPAPLRKTRARKGGKWKQSDFPVLRPSMSAKNEALEEVQKELQSCALVFDFNVASIIGGSIGAAIVPLVTKDHQTRDTGRTGLKAWSVSFKEDLVLGNRRVGTCEGEVQVCYGHTANLTAATFMKWWRTKTKASSMGSTIIDTISRNFLFCHLCSVEPNQAREQPLRSATGVTDSNVDNDDYSGGSTGKVLATRASCVGLEELVED